METIRNVDRFVELPTMEGPQIISVGCIAQVHGGDSRSRIVLTNNTEVIVAKPMAWMRSFFQSIEEYADTTTKDIVEMMDQRAHIDE